MKISKSRLFIGLVALIIIIIVILIMNIKKEETTGLVTEIEYEAEGFPVQIQVLTLSTLEKSIMVTGSAKAQRDITLLSKVGGDVERICVRMGDAFQAGDTLVEMDRESAVYLYNQAKAAHIAAEADYNSALADVKRFENLYKQGSISIKELQDVQMMETRMRSGEIAAKAARDLAWKNLQECAVTAPFAGYTGEIMVEKGDNSMPGQPVIRVVDIDTVVIEIGFTAEEAGKISRGRTVTAVFNDFGGFAAKGYIESISPAANASGTYSAKIFLPNRSLKIKPGWMAKVRITARKYDNIIAIPRSAVVERGEKKVVFVALNGTARERLIEIGDYNEDLYEIKSGLAVNDTLIVLGQTTLKDSSKVIISQ